MRVILHDAHYPSYYSATWPTYITSLSHKTRFREVSYMIIFGDYSSVQPNQRKKFVCSLSHQLLWLEAHHHHHITIKCDDNGFHFLKKKRMIHATIKINTVTKKYDGKKRICTTAQKKLNCMQFREKECMWHEMYFWSYRDRSQVYKYLLSLPLHIFFSGEMPKRSFSSQEIILLTNKHTFFFLG